MGLMSIIQLVITIAVSVFCAWLCSYYGYKYLIKASRKQKLEEIESNKYICLNLLLEEFEENRCLLNIIKSNLTTGPPIEHLMKPADIISKYLRFQAWDELVKSGLLKIISDKQLRLYKLADRRTRM